MAKPSREAELPLLAELLDFRECFDNLIDKLIYFSSFLKDEMSLVNFSGFFMAFCKKTRTFW